MFAFSPLATTAVFYTCRINIAVVLFIFGFRVGVSEWVGGYVGVWILCACYQVLFIFVICCCFAVFLFFLLCPCEAQGTANPIAAVL